MIQNKNLLATYKLVFGLLGLSAVVTEIIVLVGRGSFAPANFFSYFTIESNIFAAAILLLSASGLLSSKPLLVALLRGAATLYMVVTGVVFAVLLSGYDAATLTAVPWDNVVLHYIMPVALLVDWLIDPPSKQISFKRAIVWLAYPLVYVVYSLVRGSIVGWYPYPFLNPATGGYAGIAITSLGIAGTVLVLSWFLVRFTRSSRHHA